jgi:beta-galactosidase
MKVILLLTILFAFIPCMKFSFPRIEIPLNENWKFNKGNIPKASSIKFDDLNWETVSLPHTWNNMDGQDGGDYYRGPAWYRNSFSIPNEFKGNKIFIKFGAAGTIAGVYINGKFAGEHKGGFAAFIFDITELLNYGGENVIAVKVDNTYYKNSAAFSITPLEGDFTKDGGLYRKVNLIITKKVHISLTDYASSGVYITQKNVSDERADISISTELKNDYDENQNLSVKISIDDRSGRIVKESEDMVNLEPQSGKEFTKNFSLNNPALWNGRVNQYLYKIIVSLYQNQNLVDQVEQPLGLRFYKVDPEKGFFLNGKPYNLHGFGLHEDRENKGRAISDEDRGDEIKDMLDIGATFVRLVHYQHAEKIYDLCDSSGIVVWTELGLVDRIDSSNLFIQNVKQQLIELIKQNYNHPSILFWGIFNEINNAKGPDPAALVKELNQAAKTIDPYRLTTAASNNNDMPTAFVTDVLGLNKYFGWYTGKVNDFGTYLDQWHKKHPGRAVGISEYGSGASIFQHEENPLQPLPSSSWHPEEYQTLFHEQSWEIIVSRPFIWCSSVWNGYDFASDNRREGFKAGINDKGLIAQDHLTKKDAYYWYKVNWNPAPMVYITEKRFTLRDTSVIDVKVYSNSKEVELFLNGNSLGKKKSDDHRFIWHNVKLNPGSNYVKAAAQLNGKNYFDECWWRYKP